MKLVTIQTIRDRWSLADKNEIDIVQEASNLFVKITIVCMFGAECADLKLKQRVNGRDVWMNLGEVMIQQFEQSNNRMFQLHNILIPEIMRFYISPSDRVLAGNQDQMRDYIRELIRVRRASLNERDNRSDLLSIMLNDPLFENNDEIILNESLSFFLAGSLAQASALSNTLSYFIQNKSIMDRAR